MKKEIEEKVTFTLRLAETENEKVKKMARQFGISQNDLIKMFINTSLDTFNKISLLQFQELNRFLSQTS